MATNASHRAQAPVSQRSSAQARRIWDTASKDLARKNRPVFRALAAFDRGEGQERIRRAS
jgi:hypothetical protein